MGKFSGRRGLLEHHSRNRRRATLVEPGPPTSAAIALKAMPPKLKTQKASTSRQKRARPERPPKA